MLEDAADVVVVVVLLDLVAVTVAVLSSS